MAEMYATSPLMQGLKTFGDLGMEQRTRDQTSRDNKLTIDAKAKSELTTQFTNDLKAAQEVLKKAKDPQQRAAVAKVLEQMKQVYTGSYAQQMGLDGTFSRQIDFITQTPFEDSKLSGSIGTSLFERNLAGLDPAEQERLRKLKAETDARGGKDPFKTKLDTEHATEYKKIEDEAVSAAAELENLKGLSNVVEALGPNGQGYGMQYVPSVTKEAQAIDKAAVEQALQKVNQTKGAVSDKEMELFAKASIGTGNRIELNRAIIQAARAVTIRKAQRAEFYAKYYDAVGNVDQAANAFKKFADENPIYEYDSQNVKFLKSEDEVYNDRTWENYIPKTYSQDLPAMNNSPQAIESAMTPGSNPPAAPSTNKKMTYNPTTGEFE